MMTMRRFLPVLLTGVLLAVAVASPARAQSPAKPGGAVPTPATRPAPVPAISQSPAPPPGVAPADFVIGPDDVLTIVFWREKDLSGDVVVRPDGRISIPLLNDVQAAGLTPEQLREKLIEAAGQFLEDPNATVVVKEIHSRRVFITGQVSKPGAYVLTRPTTVLQLISISGGLLEFADQKNIVVNRSENGRQVSYPFNYKDVARRKNLKQNIELLLGDTVIVP